LRRRRRAPAAPIELDLDLPCGVAAGRPAALNDPSAVDRRFERGDAFVAAPLDRRRDGSA